LAAAAVPLAPAFPFPFALGLALAGVPLALAVALSLPAVPFVDGAASDAAASAAFSSTWVWMAFSIAWPARPKSWRRCAVAQSCDAFGAPSWPWKWGMTFSAKSR
jgi:hypothetical protein